MSRLAVSCAVLLSATALAAACSVYDEGLLGAGGVDDTSSSKAGKGNGGEDGDGGRGGAGPTTTTTTTDGATTSTDANTSTADGSTGQTGTVTTGSQCETPDDCPGEDSECSTRSCEGNQCSVINLEAGFILEEQTAGDCVVQICDGEGNVISDVDDADLPAQTDDCILTLCNNGVPGEEDAPERDPCGVSELCDGNGVCVECLEDGDCSGNEDCGDTNVCVAPQCDDGSQNGDETDTDCGGGTCPDCQNGDTCSVDADCVSNDCNGTCQTSCTDGVIGPGEADVDCGGVCPLQCGLGSDCTFSNDCGSDFCLAEVCTPALFFSEYVEGSSNSKALEIFNFGNEPVDLAAATCAVRIYSNGSVSASQNIGLTGSVAEFGVRVLCKDTAAAGILAECDQPSSLQLWNGNDAISLECGGVVLDVFGQVGFDPGAGSTPTPGWGTGLTNSVDNTLRRKGGITEGDRNGGDAFDPAVQWDGFATDDFTGLGDHP